MHSGLVWSQSGTSGCAGRLRPPHILKAAQHQMYYAVKDAVDRGSRMPVLQAVATAELVSSSALRELKSRPDFHDYESATKLMSTLQQETDELTQLLRQNDVSVASLEAIESQPAVVQAPVQTLSAQARRDRREQLRLERRLSNSAGGAATTDISGHSASRRALSATDTDALSQHKLALEGTFRRSPDVELSAQQASSVIASSARPTTRPRPRRSMPTAAQIVRRPVIAQATPAEATLSSSACASSSAPTAAVGAMLSSATALPTSFDLTPMPATVYASTRSGRKRSARSISATTKSGGVTASQLSQRTAANGEVSLNAPGDGTSILMKPASSVLLTATQEKDLAMVAQDLMFLKRVRKQLQQALKRAPTDQEWARAVDMDDNSFAVRRQAGERAKQVMLQSNYRLVISVCKKYQYKGTHMQDLIAEGIQGLLRGIEKYDASKGFRFSTYAHWWIRQAVTRSIADQGRTVRLPVHVTDALSRIRSAQVELQGIGGREVSPADVAAAVGMSVEKMNEILDMAKSPNSLEQPMAGGDGTSTMADLLEDDRASPEDQLTSTSMSEELETILRQLGPREAGVLRMRYGLDDGREKTLEECGNHFQVTRERIRQIEAKALLKLKTFQLQLDKGLEAYSILDVESRELATRNSLGTRKT